MTTTIGAEGMPGLEAVATVADAPAELAAALVALLCQDRGWAERSTRQAAYAGRHFSRTALADSLFDALARHPSAGEAGIASDGTSAAG